MRHLIKHIAGIKQTLVHEDIVTVYAVIANKKTIAVARAIPVKTK